MFLLNILIYAKGKAISMDTSGALGKLIKNADKVTPRETTTTTKNHTLNIISDFNFIKPKIIVLLGASAKETPRIDGIEYFQVIHPSAAMRFTIMREKFRLQIAQLAKKLQEN